MVPKLLGEGPQVLYRSFPQALPVLKPPAVGPPDGVRLQFATSNKECPIVILGNLKGELRLRGPGTPSGTASGGKSGGGVRPPGGGALFTLTWQFASIHHSIMTAIRVRIFENDKLLNLAVLWPS